MKKLFLLFLPLFLVAGELNKYGFEFKNGAYNLVEFSKAKLCLNKLCELSELKTKGEKSFISSYKDEQNQALNSYENNLFFIENTKLTLGELERTQKLHFQSAKQAFDALLKDKERFLNEKSYFGDEFHQSLKISKITKDKIFFENFVTYSYSQAAHPSFYQSGFSLDTKNFKLKSYILADVIKDNKEVRKFLTKALEQYFNENGAYDFVRKNYFDEDEWDFNLFKQEVVFKQDGLYINLRSLLSEAGRNLDFFELDYKSLKSFAKGDLARLIQD